MKRHVVAVSTATLFGLGVAVVFQAAAGCSNNSPNDGVTASADPDNGGPSAVAGGTSGSRAVMATSSPSGTANELVGALKKKVLEGRQTFRFDTFGDEAYWGGKLRLHEAIAGAAHGGAGAGVSPKAALALGLKVDADALPKSIAAGIKSGEVSLEEPATTLELLRSNAVVGLKGFFEQNSSKLLSIGIECALCHSTVDDSFSPGVGKRLDGWPNRDINVGAIVNLSPDLTPLATQLGVSVATVRAALAAWGPGRFDAELLLDGKATRPDGATSATLIPPAYGLLGVNLHTYTGWGSIPYWNAFVGVLEMHGQGNFFDPRLDNATQFPVAAKNRSGHTTVDKDLVSSKLAGLQAYQLSIPAPMPAAGTFDEAAAKRGEKLFDDKAKCATCHTEPLYVESGWSMHTGAEIGIDEFQASRSPDMRYRTTPLRGLVAHAKGGYFHDGRFATLLDVVNHYDATFTLGLTPTEKSDLVEYLKSL
jgi:cytochrome c peroxidase